MNTLIASFSVVCFGLLASCASSPRGGWDASQFPEPRLGEWHEREVAAFEAADAESMPEPGQVLGIGSSSIRMWKTLGDDMAPAPVLNRGFGGSTTPEVLAVIDRIVLPYEPAAIVYYCGDNDLGTENTDSRSAAGGFVAFAERVHQEMPGTPILYLAIKPSIARWNNWPAMAEANRMVAQYAAKVDGVEYIDVATCLLGEDGRPDPALFLGDGLHLNADGYARWTAVLRPKLHAALGID